MAQSQQQQLNNIPIHPLANIFPMMTGAEYSALFEDIAENGLREPIKLYQGQIIDGRNRYRACDEAGVPPRFEEVQLDEGEADEQGALLKLIVSLNLHRRQLTSSQLAGLALDLEQEFAKAAKERQLATLKQGSQFKCPNCRTAVVSYSGEFCRACLDKADSNLEVATLAANDKKANKTTRFYDGEIDDDGDEGDYGDDDDDEDYRPKAVVQKSAQRGKGKGANGGKASEQVAKALGTNHQYVTDAKKLGEKTPDLLPEVVSGTLTIPDAKVLSGLKDAETRAEAIELIKSGKVKNAREAKQELSEEEDSQLPPDKQLAKKRKQLEKLEVQLKKLEQEIADLERLVG